MPAYGLGNDLSLEGMGTQRKMSLERVLNKISERGGVPLEPNFVKNFTSRLITEPTM